MPNGAPAVGEHGVQNGDGGGEKDQRMDRSDIADPLHLQPEAEPGDGGGVREPQGPGARRRGRVGYHEEREDQHGAGFELMDRDRERISIPESPPEQKRRPGRQKTEGAVEAGSRAGDGRAGGGEQDRPEADGAPLSW